MSGHACNKGGCALRGGKGSERTLVNLTPYCSLSLDVIVNQPLCLSHKHNYTMRLTKVYENNFLVYKNK